MKHAGRRTLTEAETRLMHVLWRLEQGSVSEVVEALNADEPTLAFNTVQTTLRVLEQKGFVRHQPVKRTFVYTPRVSRAQAQESAIEWLVERFFDGTVGRLAVNLFEKQQLKEDDLAQIETLIRNARNRR